MVDPSHSESPGSETVLWTFPAGDAAAPAIGEYELLARIGKGAFGEVWIGRQRLTGVLYAVKVIARDAVGAIELDGIRLQKQSCRGHPHLVAIEHVGETPGAYYYVMELADDARGPGVHDPAGYQPLTLKEDLVRSGSRAADAAVGIALEILDGLDALHRAGLLHRDVKPANIMRQNGRWKLGDMGLVTQQSRPSGRGFTPGYAPPGGVTDRAGDLYCVGRVLQEMLGGAAGVASAPRPERERLGRVRACVERACHEDPQRRFASTRDMSAALRAAVQKRGRPLSVAAVALIAMMLAGGLIWKTTGRHHSGADAAAGEPDIAVYFKTSAEDRYEQRLGARDLPLMTGNLFRTEVTLPAAAYPYLYLLFTDEPPTRRYPPDGARQARVDSFEYPESGTDPKNRNYLQLAPPVGTGALLLLVSDVPVAGLAELDRSVSAVRLTGGGDPHVLWSGDPMRPQSVNLTQRGVSPELVSAPRGTVRVVGIEGMTQFRQKRMVAFAYVEAKSADSGGS